jgi:acyl carrier protein
VDPAVTQLGRLTRSGRARLFGAVHFSHCQVHSDEAGAVYAVAERLSRETLGDFHLDATVEDVLGQSRGLIGGRDSLDIIEQLMAIEEEFGPRVIDADTEVTRSLLGDAVFRVLLGDIAQSCHWSSETIWARSFRGIINERVRWRGGCACVQASGRPTTS